MVSVIVDGSAGMSNTATISAPTTMWSSLTPTHAPSRSLTPAAARVSLARRTHGSYSPARVYMMAYPWLVVPPSGSPMTMTSPCTAIDVPRWSEALASCS